MTDTATPTATKHVSAKLRRRIAGALRRHLRAKERAIVLFQRAQSHLDYAVSLGPPMGEPIDLPDGETVTLNDQFAEKNTAFAAKQFSRYAVKAHKAKLGEPAADFAA